MLIIIYFIDRSIGSTVRTEDDRVVRISFIIRFWNHYGILSTGNREEQEQVHPGEFL